MKEITNKMSSTLKAKSHTIITIVYLPQLDVAVGHIVITNNKLLLSPTTSLLPSIMTMVVITFAMFTCHSIKQTPKESAQFQVKPHNVDKMDDIARRRINLKRRLL